jgi:hypothetical protein
MTGLKKILARALEAKQDEICAHIEKVQNEGRTTGIEAAFAKAFRAELTGKIECEQPLSIINTESYWKDRTTGRLDCYLPDGQTAFEFKAARLPRRHSDSVSGALYDIGQLVADYLRLSRAKRLEAGYIIAFVYGPLVSDAQSPGKLYRIFHNQMFVDFNVAKGDGQIDGRRIERRAYRELEWDTGWGKAKAPEWATAVKVGAMREIG